MYHSSNDGLLSAETFDRNHSIYQQIPDRFNLSAYLLEKNSGQLNKIAFYHSQRSLTYGELQQFVAKFAALLDHYDIRNEERIVILLPDCPEFCVSFLGAVWHGSVAVLINESAHLDHIVYMIQYARSSTVVTTRKWQEQLETRLPDLKHWIVLEDELFKQLEEFEPKLLFETVKDEPAFWAYTSGSTGFPKAVVHAHYNPIVAGLRYGLDTLGLKREDIIYTTSPLAFSYGLGTTLYMPMMIGASAVLSDSDHAFGFIETIHQFRPTVFFSIPHHYASILALQHISPLDVSSLRLCVSAAEQLTPTLWHAWQQSYGLTICEGIGTTESTHIFISNTPDDCKPGSSGKPVPGYQISVVDENGARQKSGEEHVGQLHIKAEGLMLGYWNQIAASQKVLCGDVLTTADIYRVDKDGYFYFLARKDDLMKVGGMWVVPGAIEQAISTLIEGCETAVIAIPHDLVAMTHQLVCFLVSPALDSQQIKTIKNELRCRFNPNQIPKKFFVIDKLPRTSTGKIDRKQLLHNYQNSEVVNEL